MILSDKHCDSKCLAALHFAQEAEPVQIKALEGFKVPPWDAVVDSMKLAMLHGMRNQELTKNKDHQEFMSLFPSGF